ncbi:sodium:proton antiporter [Zunongwangia sp. F363]|uniref:Sodium:proton antiporter n=1 Tax=Autumnicola tepida TaxID=3075595 RepID=A0ABU3C521_9FLAO|nr:sodium:proton antiporter [Zunongwangia sp. F363]MDT0641418.1 sodium:proton antiporter [Zunongwangia sp. F363]
MGYFYISTIIVFLAAIFGYFNTRFLKLPNTIGLMLITIVFSLGTFGLSYFDDTILNAEEYVIQQIDFRKIVLDFMLGFILFAGGLHTDLNKLKMQRWPVIVFATVGVLISTFLVGILIYYLLNLFLGLDLNYLNCLLFGALISPTDPIAVLGILRKAGIDKKLEIKIVGESLFNDGIGIVIFLTLFNTVSMGGEGSGVWQILKLFGQEAVGGVALGLSLGWLTHKVMQTIDDYNIEVILTLATVMVGSAIAQQLQLSAPLALATAGLFVGRETVRIGAMSDRTENYVDKFWELIDILFNTILFVLIGMEILVLTVKGEYFLAGAIAIPVVLICRYLSLLGPVNIFEKGFAFFPTNIRIMTWGGLRGGISIALALGLTEEMHRDLFLVMTYCVVVFAIIVQGLTVHNFVKSDKNEAEKEVSTAS